MQHKKLMSTAVLAIALAAATPGVSRADWLSGLFSGMGGFIGSFVNTIWYSMFPFSDDSSGFKTSISATPFVSTTYSTVNSQGVAGNCTVRWNGTRTGGCPGY